MAREDGYRLSAADVLGAADKDTVLALVNTPHNPTGAIISPDETGTLAAALAERRVPLIVDEVYHPLYFGARPPSAASMNNVLVMWATCPRRCRWRVCAWGGSSTPIPNGARSL
jgi:aspartate/methionine/tyrosine aminotransferase